MSPLWTRVNTAVGRGTMAERPAAVTGPPAVSTLGDMMEGLVDVNGASVDELTTMISAAGDETFAEVSPLTGRVLTRIPTSTDEDLAAALRRSHEFQPRWAKVPVSERAEALLRFHDLLLEDSEHLLDIICAETGKTRMDSYQELVHLALTARYYARRGPRLLATRRGLGVLPGATRIDLVRRPKGVVGLITPWNYPLTMGLCDGLAAVVAGNTVVHKPDSQAVLSTLAGLQLLQAAGIPGEAWQVVAGPGSRLGPQLVDGTDMICFTGSTRTGRALAERAGRQLKTISAELGGKNPALVLADADLEAAAEGLARACFNNSGQLCVHIERIYVDRSRYREFRDEFVRVVRQLRLAPGLSWDAEVGTLIGPEQLGKVASHVADATAKGARVLCGGRARADLAPWCFEPTVLEGVTEDMDCHLAETFGPVVSLYGFDTLDEAVELANQGDQGLNASIWSTDHERARRLARRVRAGTVNINEGMAPALASIDAPMGGIGASGMGRRQGAPGLYRFTEAQSIATQRLFQLTPFGGLDAETFTGLLTRGLKLLRHTPRP